MKRNIPMLLILAIVLTAGGVSWYRWYTADRRTPQQKLNDQLFKDLIENDRRAWLKTDSWYRGLPGDLIVDPDVERLEGNRLQVVSVTFQETAQAMLQEAPFVELEPKQAAEFLGGTLPTTAGLETRPFLVRSVILGSNTGGLGATLHKDGSLHLGFGCLGRHPLPMVRKAVVVLLTQAPKEVYLTCSMAE